MFRMFSLNYNNNIIINCIVKFSVINQMSFVFLLVNLSLYIHTIFIVFKFCY